MPEPIEYQIVANLHTALKVITVAGGYHYTVAATAVKLDPNHDVEALITPTGPRPFVLLALGDERWEYQPASRIKLVVPVTVYWVSDSERTVDESLLQTFFRGCADVERAIAIDISRGGLAIDTRILKRTLDRVIDSAQVWAEIETEIMVIRSYGSPDS